jgi:hypothetical protein
MYAASLTKSVSMRGLGGSRVTTVEVVEPRRAERNDRPETDANREREAACLLFSRDKEKHRTHDGKTRMEKTNKQTNKLATHTKRNISTQGIPTNHEQMNKSTITQ